METRVERIQALLAQKQEIDAELKQLREAIKAEAAILRASRKPRVKQ